MTRRPRPRWHHVTAWGAALALTVWQAAAADAAGVTLGVLAIITTTLLVDARSEADRAHDIITEQRLLIDRAAITRHGKEHR